MEFFLFALVAVLSLVSAGKLNSTSALDVAPQSTYDYVVVGCGISGLVMSMRLSEDPSVSVICIEAGPFDKNENTITIPYNIGRDIHGIYDWNVRTVPQTQLDNATRPIPLGRVVGGGSIINGMVWNRGNQDDYNAWEGLGNPGWSWADLLPYFVKSETYTPVSYEGLDQQLVRPVADVHGSSGPVSVSYPSYLWPQTINWFDALREFNISMVQDPDEGLGAGGNFAASAITAKNQTRSDARRSYYDAFSQRGNYDVLANAQVARVLVNGTTPNSSLKATGVEWSYGPKGSPKIILARREVILSAGAIHTPQILQLSGIGPSGLLKRFGIPVLQDFPGVGSNLQDHSLVYTNYPYLNKAINVPDRGQANKTFFDDAAAEYSRSRTGPWTAGASNAVAFPSLDQIANHIPASTRNQLNDAIAEAFRLTLDLSHLPEIYHTNPSLQQGYFSHTTNLVSRITENTPAYEILNNNAGCLTVSLMHPLSRGTVTISSTSIFDPPLIDPLWSTHPLDTATLLAALQFNSALLNTSSLRALQPSYNVTLPQSPSESVLRDYIKQHVQTEFHSSGTAAMMPQDQGGVVDPRLSVYGVQGLRVVDTSIFPLIPAAHLQSVAYAVAEKAADLVKEDWSGSGPVVGSNGE